jgi:drug/metabolite transporter (DMT)-like permease
VRGESTGEQPLAVIVVGCVLAAMIAAVAVWPEPPYPQSSRTPFNTAIVVYLGVCQISLAYVLVTRGMRRVTALEASLLLLTEPVFTPLWAWLLVGEVPAPLALVGGALIVMAVAANTFVRGVSSAPKPTGSV